MKLVFEGFRERVERLAQESENDPPKWTLVLSPKVGLLGIWQRIQLEPYSPCPVSCTKSSPSSFDFVFCCLRDRSCCLWTAKEKDWICSKTEEKGVRHGVWFATPTVSRGGGTGENLPPRFATSSIFLPLRERNCLWWQLQASQTAWPEWLLFAECYSKQLPVPHRSGASHTFSPRSTTQLPSLPLLFCVHTTVTCSPVPCTYSVAASCHTGGLKNLPFIGHICSLGSFSSNKSSFCLGPQSSIIFPLPD